MITNLTDLKKCVEWLKANEYTQTPGPWTAVRGELGGFKLLELAHQDWPTIAAVHRTGHHRYIDVCAWVVDELRAVQERDKTNLTCSDVARDFASQVNADNQPGSSILTFAEVYGGGTAEEQTKTADEFLRIMMANPGVRFASRSCRNTSGIHWYDPVVGLRHNYIPIDKLPGHGNTRTTDQGHFFRSGPYRVTMPPVPVVIGGEKGPPATSHPYDPSPEEPEEEVAAPPDYREALQEEAEEWARSVGLSVFESYTDGGVLIGARLRRLHLLFARDGTCCATFYDLGRRVDVPIEHSDRAALLKWLQRRDLEFEQGQEEHEEEPASEHGIGLCCWVTLDNGWQFKFHHEQYLDEQTRRSIKSAIDACLNYTRDFEQDNDCEVEIRSVTVGGKRWEVRRA